MPYTPLAIQNKKSGKRVLFSLPVMNHFRKMQHTVLCLKRGKYAHPYTAMLGCNEAGVIMEIITLVPGIKEVGGCDFAPVLEEETLTKGITRLIKKGLTPCGILRILYSLYKGSKCLFDSPVGNDFRRLFMGTSWCSVTVGCDEMIIEVCKWNRKEQRFKPTLLGWDISIGGTK